LEKILIFIEGFGGVIIDKFSITKGFTISVNSRFKFLNPLDPDLKKRLME
jgi:hypothetical protein